MPKLIAAALFIATIVYHDNITVLSKDFKPSFGKWKGTLTYLDYKSGKPYTMPANITISKDKQDKQRLVFAFEYPDEPKANGNDTLMISRDGSTIDGALVVSKQKDADGNLQIITDKAGFDGNDNRAAILRHIYTIGKKIFINRKEVKFDGEEVFIMRNEFKMSR